MSHVLRHFKGPMLTLLTKWCQLAPLDGRLLGYKHLIYLQTKPGLLAFPKNLSLQKYFFDKRFNFHLSRMWDAGI
jgi:hypothetical protein